MTNLTGRPGDRWAGRLIIRLMMSLCFKR